MLARPGFGDSAPEASKGLLVGLRTQRARGEVFRGYFGVFARPVPKNCFWVVP